MSTIHAEDVLATPESGLPSWMKEAKAAVRDLSTPNPWIYWTDMLVSTFLGYGFGIAFLDTPGVSWMRGLYFVGAVLSIYRASSFAHELVHMREGSLRYFPVAWDLLCGIPFVFPSFAYTHHLDHHRCDKYGTEHDGEYLAFGLDPPRLISYFLLQNIIWPYLVVFRFTVLTPISFLYPPFRPWLLTRFSSFGVCNFRHRLEINDKMPLKYWAFLDASCSIRVWMPISLVLLGVFPWTRLALMFVIAATVLSMNFIRVLSLHNYMNDHEELSYLGQLQDSITIPGNKPITELFVPLGLRYHALHHMFPSLPYHSLAQAHNRLMERLPAGSDYHQTVRSGIGAIFVQFWKNTWHRPQKSLSAVPSAHTAAVNKSCERV